MSLVTTSLKSYNVSLSGTRTDYTFTARDSNRTWFSIACSSDGTKLVACDNGGTLYTSTNSGVTWITRDSSRNWATVASSSDGVNLVATETGGQIYTSINSGVSWTPRDSNRAWNGVASSADGTKLVAVVLNGQIYTSTNSGVSWTPRDSNRQWVSVTSSSDGNKLAATVNNGQIYTSTNSGATWSPRDSNRVWKTITSSTDGNKLAAVVLNGFIYTSTDSGVTWVPRESSRQWIAIASNSDGSKLIAAVDSGSIYTTINNGVTWSARDSSRAWISVASSSDGSKLFAVVNGGQIYAMTGLINQVSNLTYAKTPSIFEFNNTGSIEPILSTLYVNPASTTLGTNTYFTYLSAPNVTGTGTTASTLFIDGAPTGGTLTNAFSINVLSGITSLSGGLILSGPTIISSISGSGAVDFSGSSGLFRTSTGAVTIGPGAVGITGNTTMTASRLIQSGNTVSFVAAASAGALFSSASLQIVNDPTSSGTVTQHNSYFFGRKTLTATNSTTYTNKYTIYIEAPPLDSTNVTLTTRHTIGMNWGSFINLGSSSAVDATNQIIWPLGTVALPTYTFLNDTNTGIYSSAADNIDFATNGVNRFNISNSGATFSNTLTTFGSGSQSINLLPNNAGEPASGFWIRNNGSDTVMSQTFGGGMYYGFRVGGTVNLGHNFCGGTTDVHTTVSAAGQWVFSGFPAATVINAAGAYGALSAGGASVQTNVGGGATANFNISCFYRIRATEFDAYSSRKIKIVKDLDYNKVVDNFALIPFYEYTYKDPIKNGQATIYGIVAEELDKIFPDYVEKTNKEFVPNIYERAIISIENNKTILTLDNPIDIDKIEDTTDLLLYNSKNEKIEVNIDSLSATEIIINKVINEPNVWVYGTKETCPSVTKNHVFELGLCVTQFLLKEYKKQANDIQELKQIINELKK